MLSVMVATMLAMAAKDPLEAPRKAYYNCLVDIHNQDAKDKKTVEEFTADATAACPTEKQAFSDAVYKSENPTNKKSLDADAKERADQEVGWVIEGLVDSFTGAREEGGQLSKQ